jgi:hypothetical protein
MSWICKIIEICFKAICNQVVTWIDKVDEIQIKVFNQTRGTMLIKLWSVMNVNIMFVGLYMPWFMP